MKTIIKICFKLFGQNAYNIPLIRNIIYSNAKLKEDLQNNEKVFNKLNIPIKQLKNKLKKFDINYFSNDFSWHYFIFCGLSENYNELKILEIGTSEGNFTNFLSKCFESSNITTIDLSITELKELNKNISEVEFKNFINKRTINLDKNNITFVQINSKDILKKFKQNSFDLIWVDGDHKTPQVQQDIDNAITLIKNKGIVCCDDIVMSTYKNDYVDSDSYKHLINKKNLTTYYLNKRIRRSNYDSKKYVSVSIVNK